MNPMTDEEVCEHVRAALKAKYVKWKVLAAERGVCSTYISKCLKRGKRMPDWMLEEAGLQRITVIAKTGTEDL